MVRLFLSHPFPSTKSTPPILTPLLLGATFSFQDGEINPYLTELRATVLTFYLAWNTARLILDLNKGICGSRVCHFTAAAVSLIDCIASNYPSSLTYAVTSPQMQQHYSC